MKWLARIRAGQPSDYAPTIADYQQFEESGGL